MYKVELMDSSIPNKANRVVNVILLGLLLILIRVWYLATVERDEHVERARKPQRRTVVEAVERGTIRDRFNIPLALNKIQYNAAVCYADIRHIPNARWEQDASGKRVRVQERSEYIKKLSCLLGEELAMDPQKIEDTIHGSASLFPHTPFVIKENLSEQQYYRLKMLEKDWIGIHMQRGSKRYYPLGKTASDVIGCMGAISSKEYYGIAEELALLQTYLNEREEGNTPMLPKGFQNPFQVRERLKQLQEKAYSINDLIGKTGVEATFDSEMRGYAGKKTYEIDIKGNNIHELPGARRAIPGQRIVLSLSSELQEYAEQLLTEHEKIREVKKPNGEPSLSTPWIKGGAIVAMDPKTGEVLALASYPRIDPNDFIPSKLDAEHAKKQAHLVKWLENETYMGEIWDGIRPLERERFDSGFYEETLPLTLENYLESILSSQSAAKGAFSKICTLNDALFLEQEAEKLLSASGQSDMGKLLSVLYRESPHRLGRNAIAQEAIPLPEEMRRNLDHYIGTVWDNDDKLLVLDICRMLVYKDAFDPELAKKIGSLSLGHYRALNQAALSIQRFLEPHIKTWFHELDFQAWRTEHFKEYLKQKRAEEREKKRYVRPYTEYLERKEKELFQAFWNEHRWALTLLFLMGNDRGNLQLYAQRLQALHATLPIDKEKVESLKAVLRDLNCDEQLSFLKTMRRFEEMNRPLFGRYRSLRNLKGVQLEKHLAAAFYPLTGYGFGRSQAFRQTTPQGSVFKILVAYQALLERYRSIKESADVNPLTLIDDIKWHSNPNSNDRILGYTLDGKTITRLYKGGRLPRTHPGIGKIDVVGAIEQSSNIYFSLLAAEHLENPMNLIHASRQFGFGEKSGIELPGEIAGILPGDIVDNLTNLYSFAIGQHSLIVTPLQSAVMMSAIVNQGHVLKPTITRVIAGREPLREYRDPFSSPFRPFQEALSLVGIDFPLFTSLQPETSPARVWYAAPEIRRSLPMPDAIRTPLMQGMHRVIAGPKGTARPEIVRSLYRNPLWRRNYLDLKDQMIGKTGTAEIMFKQTLDVETEAKIHNHIWFAGAVLDPDLVVVVYLRFSEAGGREAAPLATEIAKKWRTLCDTHQTESAAK